MPQLSTAQFFPIADVLSQKEQSPSFARRFHRQQPDFSDGKPIIFPFSKES